jgi:hypothetical protein
MTLSFIFIRIAGLKASLSCLGYFDNAQLTSKLMPQACCMLMDKSSDVREVRTHTILTHIFLYMFVFIVCLYCII